MTDPQVHEQGDRGGAAISRRAVVGATVGGIGGAAVVGITAAAAWPDSGDSGGATDTGHGVAGSTAAGAEIDFAAEPGDDFVARDPILPPRPAERVHDITVRAHDQDVGEIAPGVAQQLWTFDEVVPGPFYRGTVGDQFNVTLVNEGAVGHSIDFHASKVAWNDKMRTIEPGERLEYPFEAKHAGVFMYHCGTPPALHHIGAGMYGAIIIDPPGLAPVDHEFAFVQSEFYTGAQGQVGDLTKMQSSAWDAVVFNGYVNQYQHRPIRVEPGERIRAWVLDAGPSENSAFHVIGTVFDTVYKEGSYRVRPDDGGRGGSQALDLQPCQGGFVEFSFDEPGLYPFVTHKFANVGIGALGIFQAGEVDSADAGAGH